MSVRVYFKINRKIPVINFGLSLFSVDEEYIFGTNTIFDKKDVSEFIKKGYYQVNLRKIPFTTNTYYIHTSIAGENFSSYYAFAYKTNMFNVIYRKKNEGILDLDHSWGDGEHLSKT